METELPQENALGAIWREPLLLTWSVWFTDVRLLNTATGQEVIRLDGPAVNFQFSRDSSRLLGVLFGGKAIIWDTTDGQEHFARSSEDLSGAQWDPGESRVVTWSSAGMVQVWDVASGAELVTIHPEDFAFDRTTCTMDDVSWRPDGRFILVNAGACGSSLWDVRTGEKEVHPVPIPGVVSLVMWRGTRAAFRTDAGCVQIWDSATDRVELTLSHPGGWWIEEMVWNEAGTRLLTRAGGVLRMWDTLTGELLFTLQRDLPLFLGGWSSDEARILTATSLESIQVWDAQTGALLIEIPMEGSVLALQWNPEGTQFISLSQPRDPVNTAAVGGSTRVWDAVTGTKLLTLPVLSYYGASLPQPWSQDGSRVLLFSTSGLRIVDVRFATYVDYARELLGGMALSPEQ